MYRCTYCEYSTPYLHNLKRHEKNKHSNAPTNSLLQPEVAYSSTEIPQHLTSYQLPVQSGSGVYSTQQYDPRSIPQIQYNEIQAGAELGQAPFKLGLDFNLIFFRFGLSRFELIVLVGL